MRPVSASLLIALLATSVNARAQSGIQVRIAKSGTKLALIVSPKKVADAVTAKEAVALDLDHNVSVDLACTPPDADCAKVVVALRAKELTDGAATAADDKGSAKRHVEFDPATVQGKTNRVLVVTYPGVDSVKLAFTDDQENKDTGAKQETVSVSVPDSLFALVSYDCRDELAIHQIQGSIYSAQGNYAYFLVDARANVFQRPAVNQFDEDDRAIVRVVAHPALLSALHLERTSAFRMPNALAILGGEVDTKDFKFKSRGKTTRIACVAQDFTLADFQAGRAEITLAAVTNKGDAPIGSFAFGVNALYRGAFAFGAVRTMLRDPKFGLVAKGMDSVITVIEDPNPRTLYMISYVPFIWGKRDLEKEPALVAFQRLNPMIGITIENGKSNFLLGANYDLRSMIFITGGVHLGRVRSLNSEGGAQIGGVFKGTAAQIPVTTGWDQAGFVGVSIDLRAAADFLKKVSATP